MGYWTIVGLATLIALVSMRFMAFNPQLLEVVLVPTLLNHPSPF